MNTSISKIRGCIRSKKFIKHNTDVSLNNVFIIYIDFQKI